MKKIGLLFVLFSLIHISISAQRDRSEIMEKMESKKVAYISEKLDLSPEEAQSFWPLHNEYQNELKALRKSSKLKSLFKEEDANTDELLDKMLEQEEKHLSLKKEYAYKMKNVLGSKKTLMYYHFERQFKEEMLRGLKKKRAKRAKDKN